MTTNRQRGPAETSPHATNRGAKPKILQKTAALDWITCTTKNFSAASEWYDIFWDHVHDETVRRETGYPTWAHQQQGFIGVKSEHAFIGNRGADECLFVTWGEVADRVWPLVAPKARTVSRVDLAVTIVLDYPIPDYANDMFVIHGRPKFKNWSYWENGKGGASLYVGSRESRRYGRIYDKGAQAKTHEPGLRWRYELEVKDKPRNLALLKSLLQKWSSDSPAADDIADYVYHYFMQKGIEPLFSDDGKALPEAEVDLTLTKNDRKIRWLRQQVAPSLQYLISEGLGNQALEALGLDQGQLPFWDSTLFFDTIKN